MIKEKKIPSGYKNSILGSIPKEWEVKSLEEVSLINMGQSPDSNFYNENKEGLPLIQGNADMDDRKSIIRYYTSHLTKVCDEGDFILSVRAPVGSIGIAGYKSCIGRGVCSLKPKNIDKEYLYQILLNSELSWKKLEQGSTFTAIGSKEVKEFKIAIAKNSNEQTAIANLLSTWDKAIQNINTLIEQKQNRKKWLMQMLLTGKKRLKGFEKEKWKEVRLGDIFERVTKKNTERNQTVVTISAQRGFVMQNDYFNKIIASELLDNYFLVERGEFCYNKSYSNGYPMGATKRLNDFEKAVVTTLYICFKIKDYNKSSGKFFEHLFDANALDKGLMTIANEGGRAHGLLNVTTTDFFNIRINIPGFNEQEEISKILSASNEEIQLLQNKLEQLKEQKKGLMQILLTGKKRLKVI